MSLLKAVLYSDRITFNVTPIRKCGIKLPRLHNSLKPVITYTCSSFGICMTSVDNFKLYNGKVLS